MHVAFRCMWAILCYSACTTALPSRTQLGEEEASGPHDASAGTSVSGVCLVLAAAACAATYKVCFRRLFGDVGAPFVMLVLAILGGWAVTLGSGLLLLVDGEALSEVHES